MHTLTIKKLTKEENEMKKYIRPEAEYIEFYSEEEITAGAFGGTSLPYEFTEGDASDSWDQ